MSGLISILVIAKEWITELDIHSDSYREGK
jgi:hypothetical protein